MTAPGFLVPENRSFRPSTHPWKTTLLCFAALAPSVTAQVIVAPPPAAPPLVPSAVEAYQTNQPIQQVFGPSAAASSTPPSEPFQWGPFVIRPNINYQFLYGNGIQSSAGESQDTIVQQFAPGILLQAGLHWSLDYTPTFIFYSSSVFQNAINQNVQLQWGTAWRDWFLSASQSYAYTDEPQIETAGQTAMQTYTTAFNGTYHINDQLSTDLGLNQTLNYLGQNSSTNLTLGLANSRTWSTMNWLNDQFWPRLSAGIGAGLGFNQIQGSPNSVFQLLQARANWRATDKISLQASGGIQILEYASGGASSLITPIFSGGLQYQPFDQTKFSVNASRSVDTSDYEGQIVETTSVLGDYNQRLFGFLILDLSGGYTLENYNVSVAGLSTSRNDSLYTFIGRLSCPFPKRGTASIFYQYSQNFSNQSGFAVGSSAFAFSSNQVGFSLSYNY